jgi:hypothetical protein
VKAAIVIYAICNPLYNFLVDTKRQTRFPTAMAIEILAGSKAALILITPSLFNP